MHEFALTEDLLKVARDEALKHNLVRIDKIIISVGTLSGICVDSIEFAFSFLREEDPLTEKTELVVEKKIGRGTCTSCGREIELEDFFLYCPYCNTPTVEISEGREFLILSLEGEDESGIAEESRQDT